MIEENSEPKSPVTGKARKAGCKAFRKLKDFQVDRYRAAVDENMWYMGERLGRAVDWAEAEDDFLHNGYYGCAPLWRKQYCAHRCDHFSRCDLGRLLVQQESVS